MKPRRRDPEGRRDRAGEVDEALIHRIGWQLAILTGVLLLALLVAMGGAVYLRTRDALLQPIQQTLVARANDEAHPLALRGQHICPPNFGGPTPGCSQPPQPPGAGRETQEGDVYLSKFGKNLHVVASNEGGPNGRLGRLIPDPAAARLAWRTRQSGFSTIEFDGTDYRVYTTPVAVSNKTGAQETEIIQTSASEAGYEANISALAQILLIVGLLGIGAAVLITIFVVRRALRPIRTSLRRQRNFVADAAHELRTPLTIIRSLAEMAIRSDNDDQQDMGEVTLRETAHLTKLVNDLSFLARSDTGNLDIERKPVDLQALVSDVSSDMEVLAEERDVTVESHLAPGGVRVMGDAGPLRQLVLILLDNALKYSPQGGRITITLDRTRRTARLRVRDSGQGIAPNELEHIFDRFYRATSSREGEGTGLGLAIAQSIVRAHHGEIGVTNGRPSGAIFTVTLPVTSRTGSAPVVQPAEV